MDTPTPKCVIILSGGQDSTTCLFYVRQQFPGFEIHALTFDYGQRHDTEIEAAKKICELAGVTHHKVIELPDVFSGNSPLTNHDKKVGQYASADELPGGLEDTFVPGRNILFLSIAGSYANSIGAGLIVTGVSQEDFGGYPDCRQNFILAMEKALQSGLGQEALMIITPLINRTKRETVELAMEIPGCLEAMEHTHTCYNGEWPPCGKCHACLLRQKGFEEAGVPDPIMEGIAG